MQSKLVVHNSNFGLPKGELGVILVSFKFSKHSFRMTLGFLSGFHFLQVRRAFTFAPRKSSSSCDCIRQDCAQHNYMAISGTGMPDLCSTFPADEIAGGACEVV
jgi:hypothetical protein